MPDYETIPWDVVKIPAWLDDDASELLDLPVGSSYFPEWKPDHVLKVDENEIKASNGSRYWNALYMQDPTPEEGGLIKKKWLQNWEYDEPPTCDFVIQTFDTVLYRHGVSFTYMIKTKTDMRTMHLILYCLGISKVDLNILN